MKILVKRTGTENFSKPTSSSLEKQGHSRDIRDTRDGRDSRDSVYLCVPECIFVYL